MEGQKGPGLCGCSPPHRDGGLCPLCGQRAASSPVSPGVVSSTPYLALSSELSAWPVALDSTQHDGGMSRPNLSGAVDP